MISTVVKITRAVVPQAWAALRKPKSYPLPKCPVCNARDWVGGQRYVYERWPGAGPTLYMTAACSECGLQARFAFFRFGNWLQKKGWYFE